MLQGQAAKLGVSGDPAVVYRRAPIGYGLMENLFKLFGFGRMESVVPDRIFDGFERL